MSVFNTKKVSEYEGRQILVTVDILKCLVSMNGWETVKLLRFI